MGFSDDEKSLNVVAVFAHPDDEAACIGTLANHVEKGDKVDVIFLTQGENASSLCCSPEEIKEIRKGHVKKIEQILGAKYHLLDLPDSGVFPSVTNAKKLATLFKQLKPNIVITWGKYIRIGAGHPDHRYTFDIVLDAISYARYKDSNDKYPPHRAPISLYTSMLGLEGQGEGSTVFIDVSNQLEKIEAVLKVYEEAYGQWPVFQFKSASMLLVGRLAGKGNYVEVFKKLTWRAPRKYLD
ncbi:MAG: PIG-L deacetylase family protein [Candidatus Heimdallarchaeaceae archaeon]